MAIYSRSLLRTGITFFKNRTLLLASLLLLAVPHSIAQSPFAAKPSAANPDLNDPAIEARIEELLKKMTIEEKVGQLVQYSAGQPTGPGTGRTDYPDMLAKGEIGAPCARPSRLTSRILDKL